LKQSASRESPVMTRLVAIATPAKYAPRRRCSFASGKPLLSLCFGYAVRGAA